MNQTEKALERGESLPPVPEPDSGTAKGWIQLVQCLENRFRRNEEKKLALEANAIAQEAQLGHLLAQRHANIAWLYENLCRAEKAQRQSEGERKRCIAVKSASSRWSPAEKAGWLVS